MSVEAKLAAKSCLKSEAASGQSMRHQHRNPALTSKRIRGFLIEPKMLYKGGATTGTQLLVSSNPTFPHGASSMTFFIVIDQSYKSKHFSNTLLETLGRRVRPE